MAYRYYSIVLLHTFGNAHFGRDFFWSIPGAIRAAHMNRVDTFRYNWFPFLDFHKSITLFLKYNVGRYPLTVAFDFRYGKYIVVIYCESGLN